MRVLSRNGRRVELDLEFPIDSKVYYIRNNKPYTCSIRQVTIKIDVYGDAIITYMTDSTDSFTSRDDVFSTMEALIDWISGKTYGLKDKAQGH